MDSKFITFLDARSLDDGHWEVLRDLVYQSEKFNGTIIAPAGFVTDLASVPRVPIFYEIFGNRAHHEAVIHDFLYQTHKSSKSDADSIFLEAMKVRGKPYWLRWAMYIGVKLGGGSSYKSGPSRFTLLNIKSLGL